MARFRAMPYAKALHEVVQKEAPERAEEVLAELDVMVEVLDTVPDLVRALVVPTISVETKDQILAEVLDLLGTNEPTRRFIQVVQHHYRLQQLTSIRDTYRELIDRSLGRRRAQVEVVADLDQAQQDALLAAMHQASGDKIIASFIRRPELLAGFRVQIGSKVFDGSLTGQLERLSRQIMSEQG
ncbi:MAG: ATP synthase F1 subunit delta [bacterium]|nr:ATP synthase F1 subunit delta [bacterium]